MPHCLAPAARGGKQSAITPENIVDAALSRPRRARGARQSALTVLVIRRGLSRRLSRPYAYLCSIVKKHEDF